jgi:hypothetical protein
LIKRVGEGLDPAGHAPSRVIAGVETMIAKLRALICGTNFSLAYEIRNPPPFAALCGDADRHTLWRDRFRTAVVGDTGPLSLLANDVVEC